MIFGVGSDILQISRIARLIGKPAFVRRIFTEGEAAYIRSKQTGAAQTAAGIFCAKEAFAKAIGTGVRGFWFCDIEILPDPSGKPVLSLLSDALKDRCRGFTFHLTISHEREYALAVVVCERG